MYDGGIFLRGACAGLEVVGVDFDGVWVDVVSVIDFGLLGCLFESPILILNTLWLEFGLWSLGSEDRKL